MENPFRKLSKVNPQKEEGHREICNPVFNALMGANLSGAEYKIIMAVIDKTWGFGKQSDYIAFSQFIKITGLSRQSIANAIKSTETKHIIVVHRDGTGKGNQYLLNKHYDTWLTSQPNHTSLPFHTGQQNHTSLVTHTSQVNHTKTSLTHAVAGPKAKNPTSLVTHTSQVPATGQKKVLKEKRNITTLSKDKVSPDGDDTLRIFKRIKEYLGYPARLKQDPIPNYGKEGKFIKRMLLRGFSADDIFRCWEKKVNARGGVYVSMVYVNEDIGSWRVQETKGQIEFAVVTNFEPDQIAEEIWGKALVELKGKVNKANFKTWLEKTRAISYKRGEFIIGVSSVLKAEYLSNNHRSLIESTLFGLTRPGTQIIFKVVREE